MSSIPKGFRLGFMRGKGKKYNFDEMIADVTILSDFDKGKRLGIYSQVFHHFFYLPKWYLSFHWGIKARFKAGYFLRV